MKTHTLFLFSREGEIQYCLGLRYHLTKKTYGHCFVVSQPPIFYPDKYEEKEGLYIHSYHFGDLPSSFRFPLLAFQKVKNQHPTTISVSKLKQMIIDASSELVFYTGAGLSKKAGIMDLVELEQSLYVHQFFELNQIIIEQPDSIKRKFIEFILSLYISNPTSGHSIIKELQDHFGFMVLTENRDILHQKVGTNVVERDQIDWGKFHNKRVLISWGLSEDHSGVISYMQKMGCTIVAVNLNQPTFLRDEDFWLPRDLHQVLKELKGGLLLESSKSSLSRIDGRIK